MADNVPLHNQLNVDLSRLLEDAVSGDDNGQAALKDGVTKAFTSDQREYFLYEAYTWFAKELFQRTPFNFGMYAAGLITTAQGTFNVNGTAQPADLLYPLKIYKADNTEFAFEYIGGDKKDYLDNDKSPDIIRAFTRQSNLIFAYERTNRVLSQKTSGDYTLIYIKAERIDSTGVRIPTNTVPDITLDRQWFLAVKYYAAYLACLDKGDEHWMAKSKNYYEMAVSYLPQGG